MEQLGYKMGHETEKHEVDAHLDACSIYSVKLRLKPPEPTSSLVNKKTDQVEGETAIGPL